MRHYLEVHYHAVEDLGIVIEGQELDDVTLVVTINGRTVLSLDGDGLRYTAVDHPVSRSISEGGLEGGQV